MAAGRSFLEGRIHLEGSAEHYYSDGIDDKDAREVTREDYCLEGLGTPAVPFRRFANCRTATQSFGGLITNGPLQGQQFVTNGVLGPFVHGTPTLASTIESGGDGTYAHHASLASFLISDQGFGRADVNLTDDLKGYLQVSAVQSKNGNSFNYQGSTAIISATNPFLTPAQQAAAQQTVDGRRPVIVNGVPTFTLSKLLGGSELTQIRSTTQNFDLTVGLRGKLSSRFSWDAYYTKGRTTQHVKNINNTITGNYLAAIDPVINSANGQIVCNVTLTNPGLYPGCTPINLFGPTADGGALAYARAVTSFTLTNTMDDYGANLTGELFSTWAGPIRVALSGEYREITLKNRSNAQPTDRLNCVGIRFNCVQGTTAPFGGFTTANMSASETITEGALEATVPLLRDVPLAKSFDLNGAVRYASYSVSGKATTWKVGIDWHVTDDLTFRSTRSQDIRAPTLNDLFAPSSQNPSTFLDSHTGVSATLTTRTSGNPALVPEVAQTLTVGAVYRPGWLAGFSVSIDYYGIDMVQAITNVAGSSATSQAICEASNGTNPLCNLILRPLPFSDRSSANFPTAVLSQPQNVSKTWTHGIDTEVNYAFDLESLHASWPGRVTTRLLVSHQPVLNTIQLPGQPTVNTAGVANLADWKVSFLASYSVGAWTFNTQTRWRNEEAYTGNPALAYDIPNIPSIHYTDLTVTYRAKVRQHDVDVYLSVQNLFDKEPPIYVSAASASAPGIVNTVVNGDDLIGRFFTTGLRLRY